MPLNHRFGVEYGRHREIIPMPTELRDLRLKLVSIFDCQIPFFDRGADLLFTRRDLNSVINRFYALASNCSSTYRVTISSYGALRRVLRNRIGAESVNRIVVETMDTTMDVPQKLELLLIRLFQELRLSFETGLVSQVLEGAVPVESPISLSKLWDVTKEIKSARAPHKDILPWEEV